MSEGQSLLAILALLYISDCIWWLPRQVLLLTGMRAGRWRFKSCGTMLGRQQGAPAMLPLLPLPRLTMLQAQTWDVAFSATRFSANSSLAWNTQGRRVQKGTTMNVGDDMAPIRSAGDTVKIGDAAWHTCTTPAHADEITTLLGAIQSAAPHERDDVIASAWKAHVDVDAARARLAEVRQAALAPQIFGMLQCVAMFVVAPLAASRFGMAFTIIPLGLVILSCVAINAIVYGIAHRRLHPEAKSHRRSHTAVILLSWPMAARAADDVMRHACHAFHPIAIALATESRDLAQSLGDQLLRDLHHPTAMNEIPEDARETVEAHNRNHATHILAVMTAHQLDPDRWKAAPEGAAEDLAYCPRCLSQYTRPTGDCSDCPGVALTSKQTGTT
jgi:hypothetical protein